MDRQQAERLFDLGREATIEVLLAMAARLDTIPPLELRILELEQRVVSLQKNSTNSSKPPSSDGPQVTKPKKTGSSRPAGGQKGHQGSRRALLPSDQMDNIYDLYPVRCEHCGGSFAKRPQAARVLRHQVFDLPDCELTKTEYRLHELPCVCGHRTRAHLPFAHSQFGPRVHGAVAYLSSVHRGTRRGMAEIFNALFGLDLSVGSICNILDRVSPELLPVCEDIRQNLTENLNIDETGWKSKGERRTLWGFVAPLAVYFTVAVSRGAKVLRSVLGDRFSGVITSDDYSAYSCYHKDGVRQLCWAHLIRKFKGLKEGSPDAYLFSKNCLKEVGHIFSCWHAFRHKAINRDELIGATHLARARLKQYCLRYQTSTDAEVVTRSQRMLKVWPHLFTFLTHEGVEPTNNAAERALRPAVQWRKISFGNQSEEGERFTERILTVTRTCQLQGKNAFRFLSDLMHAAFNGSARPSLTP